MAAIGDLVATMRMNTKPFAAGAARAQGTLKRLGTTTVATTGAMSKSMTGMAATTGVASKAFFGLAASIKAVTVAFLPLTAIAAFAGIVRSGETFNQKMRQSLAIMGDVSDAMKGEMREAAFAVASSTKFAASEAAEAFFFLASAHLNVEQSLAALPQVAAFAQAGLFDISRATELATDAQSTLGMKVADATQNLVNLTRVTDVLTAANTMADATVEQFAEALSGKAGPALRNVNKSIEEGVAVLAIFADQGTKGEEASTRLAMVLRDLRIKAVQNEAAFKDMNIEVFRAGKMRHIADIMGDIENKLGGLNDKARTAALLKLGFTFKSLAGIEQLMGKSGQIRENYQKLLGVMGKTQEVAGKQLTPLQKLWAMISSGATQAGAAIINGINSVIGVVGRFREQFAAIGRGMAALWVAEWELISSTVSAVFTHMGLTAEGFEENMRAGLEAIAGFFNTLAFTVRNFANIAKLAINNFVLSALEAFPMMEGPITTIAETFISTWAGVSAFFGSIVDNIIGGLKEIKNFGLAVGAAISSLWESLTSGDFEGAATAAANAFIETLANQKDVVAPNAFTAYKDAAAKAGKEFRDSVTKSGGLGGSIRKANKGILQDIANDEIKRTEILKRKRDDVIVADLEKPIGAKVGGGDGKIGKDDELPKALEFGSKEAMNRILGAGRVSQKDKDAKETANNTKRTADATEDIANKPETVTVSIP